MGLEHLYGSFVQLFNIIAAFFTNTSYGPFYNSITNRMRFVTSSCSAKRAKSLKDGYQMVKIIISFMWMASVYTMLLYDDVIRWYYTMMLYDDVIYTFSVRYDRLTICHEVADRRQIIARSFSYGNQHKIETIIYCVWAWANQIETYILFF